ncbi:MAG: hypothetical protein NVSMB5_12390 [Candidatus Velthaea sp.]
MWGRNSFSNPWRDYGELTMDVRNLGDQVSLAQGRTSLDLLRHVARLSTGLRINTSADDPSGLAISEHLRAQVSGLDAGVRSVQDANNALNVADGALQTISSILQRMRALIVEGRSDLKTTADRATLQVEIDHLKREIDRISQNTEFNGKKLLDGSLSSALPAPARLLIPVNDSLSVAGSGTLLDTTTDPAQPSVSQPVPPIQQILTVDSYNAATNQLTLTAVISSTDPSFGPTQTASFTVDSGTNYQSGFFPPTPGNPSFTQTDQNGNPVLAFNIGTLTAADVGKKAIVVSLDAEVKAPGQALQVNTGAAEGSVVSIDIPAVNTIDLGVNDVQLSSDDLSNQGNEYRVDYAVEHLADVRAQIGAQSVALQAEASDGTLAAVQLQASESQVRDVDVASEVTAFVKDQLLVSIQTGILSKINSGEPQAILALFR